MITFIPFYFSLKIPAMICITLAMTCMVLYLRDFKTKIADFYSVIIVLSMIYIWSGYFLPQTVL
ncbi:hypothetical protein A7985_11575 [Pseudoalteromonas luteoviolacea]|uniref:Uncharacterized protein n=1 Tax=Pseudoalteromonas luteoviolacea TaxID=43657 RepID=A0A1C0TQT3_9GAMM|nr:hypothetical protein A7985_11575 [Pseudoalteromonas luteoviolacea]